MVFLGGALTAWSAEGLQWRHILATTNSEPYGSGEPGADSSAGVAVDGAGNVYVASTGYGIDSVADVILYKLSPTGTMLWVRTYYLYAGGEERTVALALDVAGNPCVAATTKGPEITQDIVLLKYDTEGYLTGLAEFDFLGGEEEVTAMALDRQDNIYLTGSTRGTNGDSRALLLKYDAAGFLYYVATEAYFPGVPYFILAQIDPMNGAVLWSDWTKSEPFQPKEMATAAAVTPAGEIVISGISRMDGQPDFDVATVKFEPAASWNLPRVNVTAVAPNAREGAPGDAATATFALWRTGPTNQTLYVGFYVGGTAKYVADYEPMPGLLGEGYGVMPIPAGANYALFQVRARHDRVSEGMETVRVTIDGGSLSAGRYLRGEHFGAVARILDNLEPLTGSFLQQRAGFSPSRAPSRSGADTTSRLRSRRAVPHGSAHSPSPRLGECRETEAHSSSPGPARAIREAS